MVVIWSSIMDGDRVEFLLAREWAAIVPGEFPIWGHWFDRGSGALLAGLNCDQVILARDTAVQAGRSVGLCLPLVKAAEAGCELPWTSKLLSVPGRHVKDGRFVH